MEHVLARIPWVGCMWAIPTHPVMQPCCPRAKATFSLLHTPLSWAAHRLVACDLGQDPAGTSGPRWHPRGPEQRLAGGWRLATVFPPC